MRHYPRLSSSIVPPLKKKSLVKSFESLGYLNTFIKRLIFYRTFSAFHHRLSLCLSDHYMCSKHGFLIYSILISLAEYCTEVFQIFLELYYKFSKYSLSNYYIPSKKQNLCSNSEY